MRVATSAIALQDWLTLEESTIGTRVTLRRAGDISVADERAQNTE